MELEEECVRRGRGGEGGLEEGGFVGEVGWLVVHVL